MAPERALLMIADIGGYTDYMGTHRMSLAHAEVNTARLLEAVIDAAPNFELIEIEGDAAFLSRNANTLDRGGPVAAVTQAAAGMHRAFHVEIKDIAGVLPPPDPSWPSRVGRTFDVAGRGLPYMLGLRRRRRVAAQ